MNYAEIDYIQNQAADRITEILDALGIEYAESNNFIHFCCPVHLGDNPRGAYYIHNTKSWKCHTRNCEQDEITGPSSSIFGLIRGIHFRKTGQKMKFIDAVMYIVNILGIKLDNIGNGWTEREIHNTIVRQKKRNKNKCKDKCVSLKDILPYLTKDNWYFPQRGISSYIINKYHISYCDNREKQFFQRIFVPIMNISGKYVVGYTGRSIFDKCEKCSLYHNPDWKQCPDKNISYKYAKWKHSTGFKADRHLYNIWHAKRYIAQTGVAVIVEGPVDTWKCEQSDIHNSVAILGVNLSSKQRLLLQQVGALTLIIALDNDKSGIKAQEKVKEELQHYFRLFFIIPNGKDIGEMNTEDINDQLRPTIKAVSRATLLVDKYID